MVYYQSTPLIIKSEQPSQSQLCGSLRNVPSSEHHQPLHMQHSSPSMNGYSLSSVALNMQQQQMSQNNINSNTSINSHHHQQQQQQQQHQSPPYLTSIKTELLPPGITLYATTQPASLTTTTTNQHVTSSSNNNNNNSSNNNAALQPTSTTGVTTSTPIGGGRKANPNKPQFKCEQCGMTFGSKSAHTSHTKSHIKNGETGLMNINSSIVASSTTMPNGLELNEAGLPMGIPKTPQIKPNANAATNGGDPYQCNVCQKTFAVPARLIRHYRTHTGERPFECEFCHKLFSVKENLQVHRRIHTKERPYKCDVCGRAFEHSGKLHRHMRIHTGERPHKCSVCEKTFIQSGQLVIHMRTHTGEKPYKCPVEGCGKGFTCSKQLKVHSRTHTGEKPYHCDICFRDFGYNHVLKLHRVQHYGSKCYKCTICDETFKSKKEMEAHIKGHANEMPDDEEEAAANGANNENKAATASNNTIGDSSPSSGMETISGPNSPQSPSSSVGTIASSTTTNIATTKQRKPRQEKSRCITISGPLSPSSPGSPSSSMSPSSSYASGSRLSAASPTCSVASPTMSLTMETDHHSRDSGVASGSIPPSHSTRHLAAVTLMDMSHQGVFPTAEEMPTDLSIGQQNHQNQMDQLSQHQQQQQQHLSYHYENSPNSPQQQSQQYQYLNNSQMSPGHHQQQHQQQQQQQETELHLQQQHSTHGHGHALFEPPTINPALLEAATIASRRDDDVEQAAIQIMQLHRSQRKPGVNGPLAIATNGHYSEIPVNIHQTLITPVNNRQTTNGHPLLIDQYDETQEANDLIEHYKRGHGLVKGYAPVPKFETSLPNNEILLRQVEAAIAPLRSSTESPDRSSSPESDTMMLMADRDVMTLPLRKRKLYMSDVNENGEMGDTAVKDMGQKVMRHSSVIQFAKAS